jgi:hypothetical protein
MWDALKPAAFRQPATSSGSDSLVRRALGRLDNVRPGAGAPADSGLLWLLRRLAFFVEAVLGPEAANAIEVDVRGQSSVLACGHEKSSLLGAVVMF